MEGQGEARSSKNEALDSSVLLLVTLLLVGEALKPDPSPQPYPWGQEVGLDGLEPPCRGAPSFPGVQSFPFFITPQLEPEPQANYFKFKLK